MYMAITSSQRKDVHREWQTGGVCEKVLKAIVRVDSGLVIVLVQNQLMHTWAGTQCPGSMWKKYMNPLHRLRKREDFLIIYYYY